MKLNEILNESLKGNYYAVELEDGGGFGVQADNISQARRKAKSRLHHPSDKIKSISIDKPLTSSFNDRKEKLTKFVTNHYLLKKTPSIQKSYLRQIEKARTGKDINAIDRKIESELKAKIKDHEQKDDISALAYEMKVDMAAKLLQDTDDKK